MAQKSCKWCGEVEPKHFPFQCFKNPKFGKYKLPKEGKKTHQWQMVRRVWFQINNQEDYNCHYCGRFLYRNEVELDHYHSRSRRPDLKYTLSNLVPSCHICNAEKGSMSGDDYKERRRYGGNARDK